LYPGSLQISKEKNYPEIIALQSTSQ